MRKRGRQGSVRIGTSGYQYDHWQPGFYPAGLPKREWLRHYGQRFDAVELNNTFYRLPQEGTFRQWREQAPPGFCYAIKFSRFGSHLKHLSDPESTIGLLLERAAPLGPHLGPILVQLPPRWRVNAGRLEAFLRAAPRRHRWALEFREASWLCEEVFAILRRHNAALCVHDMVPQHPEVITADWVYLRFHGPGGNVACRYESRQVRAMATQVRGMLRRGLDVHVYFNNDVHGHAIENALELKRLLSRRLV